MPRTPDPIRGIQMSYRRWQKAAKALLTGPEAGKVTVLQKLVAVDPQWRRKVRQYDQAAQKAILSAEMAAAGIQPAESTSPSGERLRAYIRQAVAAIGLPDEKLRCKILDAQYPEIRDSQALLWAATRQIELNRDGRSDITLAQIERLIEQEAVNYGT